MNRNLRPLSAIAAAVLAALALAACERRDAAEPKAGSRATVPMQGPGAPTAGGPPAAAPIVANEADRKFATQAASAGLAEVEITRHTMEKASSAEVKQLAEHLNKDHAQANEELARIAATKGMNLPAAPGADKRTQVDQLTALSGAELDRAVLEQLAESHRASIKLFEEEASAGSDADLKAFAEKTLPTLREHLKMVEGTKAAAGEQPVPQVAKQ